jgi:hypothetical protein
MNGFRCRKKLFDYFRSRIFHIMNLQSLVYPIADFFQWSFKTLMDPLSAPFNWSCIVFCIVAITYWLRRQKAYNEKAAKEGTTI